MNYKFFKLLLFTLALFIFGGAFIFFGIKYIGFSKQTPIDLNTLTADAMVTDTVVTGDMSFIFDSIGEEHRVKDGQEPTPETLTAKWYLVSLANEQFVVVQAGEQMLPLMETLLNNTWNYVDGLIEEEPTPVAFKGLVKPIDDEVAGFLEEFIVASTEGDADGIAEMKSLVLPNMLVYNELDNGPIYIVVGSVLLLIGIILLLVIVRSIKGSRQQELPTYMP